jgi:pimeloyl-ACP methyl ester carboxylesterase
MLEDKNIKRPLYLVAHGFITGQYAVTWALAHREVVAKLVIMDVPLSPEVSPRELYSKPWIAPSRCATTLCIRPVVKPGWLLIT